MGRPVCFFSCNAGKVTGGGADEGSRGWVKLMVSPVRLLQSAEDDARTVFDDTPEVGGEANGPEWAGDSLAAVLSKGSAGGFDGPGPQERVCFLLWGEPGRGKARDGPRAIRWRSPSGPSQSTQVGHHQVHEWPITKYSSGGSRRTRVIARGEVRVSGT